MNVRGERVIVHGDSLSHHGADNAPEIWDVDQGSGRISGQPGDLLASLLLEQGAEAVRVNARVGRSAHNFFSREAHQQLLASDAAFKPSIVFVILGTNDIGLTMSADKIAMAKIRDFYKSLGADVWGVGPFMYTSSSLNSQAEPVISMMQEVFGSKFIDPRPITAIVGRAGDGVHFGGESARVTALGLADLILTTKKPFQVGPLIIGAGIAVGLALIWSYWRSRSYKLPPPLSGLGRGLALDGMKISTKDPATMTATPINKELDKLRAESSRLNDLLIEAGRGHETYNETHKKTDPLSLEWRAVHDRISALRNEIALRYGPGAPSHMPPGFKPRKKAGEDDLGGLDNAKQAFCDPNLPPASFERCVRRQKRSALGADREDPKETFKQLLLDPDPAAMATVEDLLLEHELKLSKVSKTLYSENRGKFILGGKHGARTEVAWDVTGTEGYANQCTGAIEARIEGQPVVWPAMNRRTREAREREGDRASYSEHPQEYIELFYEGSEDLCRRAIVADAWAAAKGLKAALASGGDEDTEVKARRAIHKAINQDNSKPEELYGLAVTNIDIESIARDIEREAKPGAKEMANEVRKQMTPYRRLPVLVKQGATRGPNKFKQSSMTAFEEQCMPARNRDRPAFCELKNVHKLADDSVLARIRVQPYASRQPDGRDDSTWLVHFETAADMRKRFQDGAVIDYRHYAPSHGKGQREPQMKGLDGRKRKAVDPEVQALEEKRAALYRALDYAEATADDR